MFLCFELNVFSIFDEYSAFESRLVWIALFVIRDMAIFLVYKAAIACIESFSYASNHGRWNGVQRTLHPDSSLRLKLQRKSSNRTHLVRDGTIRPSNYTNLDTREREKLNFCESSIIVDFETSQVFCLHALFQTCLSLSE